MENLLCKLINSSLVGKHFGIIGVIDQDWQQCFDMVLEQQVLAMTFPIISVLPQKHRPNFTLWSKWMAYAKSIETQSKYKREVVRKMGCWLADEGLSTMIIKGFSLAVQYPQPELRESSDIDIYSGDDFDAVNACFEKHGLQIGRADSHHVYIKIDDIPVEHHFALHNSRVKHGMEGPAAVLQKLASIDRQPTSIPGIFFPNHIFTALFTVWHAHKHFLAEKIVLRHVIDWALALRQLSESEARMVHEVKDGSSWGCFADTLTAIAIHKLQLPKDWFPQQEVVAASGIGSELEQRVWDDILNSGPTAHGRTSNHRRPNIAHRTLQNRWKFDTYSDMSAERLLWKEFVGYMKNRKV